MRNVVAEIGVKTTLVSATWTAGLTDVEAAISKGGVPVAGSPFACSQHPSLPGTYLCEVTFAALGTYLVEWSGDSGGLIDAHNVVVMETLTATKTVNVRIIDNGTRTPISGARLLFMHLDPDSGNYVVDVDTATDTGGYASALLTKGEFVIVASKAGISFSRNNWTFEIEPDALVKPLSITVSTMAVPAGTWSPPTSMVTLSGVLIGPTGQPTRFRNIRITAKLPSTYSTGGTFILVEDSVTLATDAYGAFSTPLVPGTDIEISVEGTRLSRRITVPSTNFNLQGYISGAGDFFNVVELPYPSAEEP